jgi:fructose/tagatose bisphosphate aldolase
LQLSIHDSLILIFVLFGIKNAENGGYAVGAFNVYNLEGVDAVVSAAEEEQSPAILQVGNTLQALSDLA